ncbi:hypothetical protein [Xenorhabdus doucetiae]|uniref:hypothetical protein n=1 Tax=Xenorhabdus doucetiae TaxID=351671 RepID=UPI0005F9B2B7|nr:hypothetical protein [Xenorhabdus doucetiae]
MPPAPAERPPAAQTSWATFARCRKGNTSQNQAVESTRASTGAILHYSKRAQWTESAHRGSGKKTFTPTGKTGSLTICY